jgi:hypothetical protein
MGCLGLILVVLGFVGYGVYQMVGAMNRPVTNAEIVSSFEGKIPIHPKAKLDMTTTKVIQGTAAMTRMITGKQGLAAAVFRVPMTPAAAVAWYDAELEKRGYIPTNARQPSIGQKMENQIMHQYFKKKEKEIVMVQAGVVSEDKKTDPDAATMLIVMRMTGVSATSGSSVGSEAPNPPTGK